MEENKKKNLMRQIIRFAFVGGSAFVIDYGVMTNALPPTNAKRMI